MGTFNNKIYDSNYKAGDCYVGNESAIVVCG